MKYIYTDRAMTSEQIKYIYEHSKLEYSLREKLIRFISYH